MRRAAITSVFLLLAGPTAAAAGERVASAIDHPVLREWLVAGYWTLKAAIVIAFATFVFTRGPARRPAREPVAFAACTVAIASAMALRSPSASDATAVVLAGEVVSLVGCAWLFASAMALGRCFSVLPEARGLVTNGPFRLVRHPLYLGEMTIGAGLVIASPSLFNLTFASAFVGSQTVRMLLEERALTAEFPEYADYAASTPRIMPALSPLVGGPRTQREQRA
ncbi:MAG TPA: isoprenylcysteine carboxylmethyltransferase family protein [Thermoleophilaceae bacterium]